VPAAKIREAALLYASTKPAAIQPSAAPVVHNTNGVQNYRAVFSLVALTGNYDIAGGNVAAPPSYLEMAGCGFVSRQHDFDSPRAWSDLPPRVGAGRFPVWAELIDQAQSMDLPRQIRTGDPYPLRGAVAFGMNYRMFPDSKGFLEAIDQLDFFCDTDLFLTDTARHADIVLPACSSLERSEVRCYPQKYIAMSQPVIAPIGEARSDTDIIFDLANRLGLDDPLLNPWGAGGNGHATAADGSHDYSAAFEATVDWMLEPAGITTAEMKKHPGGMPVPNPLPNPERKYRTKGFPTPSGKMEFKSSVLEKYGEAKGYEALPAYQAPGQSAEASPELAAEYPLILSSGSRLPMFQHSRTFRLPWTRSLRPASSADINPADAKALGVKQGDPIEISTPMGSIRLAANVSEITQAGLISVYHDYPDADANSIMDGDYLDPISGYPGYKSQLCAVRKLLADAVEERKEA
jgi:anaerobic selenocysteine-containing dehydrogenase